MEDGQKKISLIAASITLHFLVVASIVLSRTYVDQLFLSTYPQNWLPYFFFGGMAIVLLMTLSLSPLMSKGIPAINIGILIVLAVSIAVVKIFLGLDIPFFPFAASLWLLAVAAIIGIMAWNAVSDAFNTREFKRTAKWVTGGGSVGGLAAGLSIPMVNTHFKGDGILYLLIIFIVLSAALLLLVKPLPADKKKSKRGSSPMKYPLFKTLIILVICLVIVETFADYMLKTEVQANFSKDAIANFMGPFYGISSIITLIFQLAGVGLVLRFFGLAVILAILPAFCLLSNVGIAIHPGLWLAVAFRFGQTSLGYSFDTVGQEIAINPLPNQIRRAGKLILKGAVKPLGVGAGALVLWLIGGLVGLRGIAVVTIIVSIAWIIFAMKISRRYNGALEEAVKTKRFGAASDDLSETAIMSMRSVAQRALNDKSPDAIRFGFKLLEDFKTGILPVIALRHINSEYPEVRADTAKAAGRLEDRNALPLLVERLKIEKNPEVLWRLLEAISNIDPNLVVNQAVELLKHEVPLIRAGAILILIAAGDLDRLLEAGTALKEMILSSDPLMRRGAARAISALKAGKLEKELHQLLNDEDEEVSISAIRAIGSRHAIGLTDELVDKLGKGRRSHYAGRTLVELGDVISNLTAKIRQKRGSSLKAIVRTLAFIKGEEVEKALIEIYSGNDSTVCNIVAKESAFRARRMAVSNYFRRNASLLVMKEVEIVDLLKSAENDGTVSNFARAEIVAKREQAERRLLYWFAVATNAGNVIDAIPVMLPATGMPASPSRRASAIELFDALAVGRDLRNAVTIFETKGKTPPDSALQKLQALNDPWLARVLEVGHCEYGGEGKMDITQKVMLLRKVKLFSNLDGEVLLTIAEVAEEREMARDEMIFLEGDAPDGLYIVASGEVDIIRSGKVLATLTDGNYFGEIALLDENPRTASAKAKIDGMLLFIEKEVFNSITEDVPEVLRSVAQMVISYLRHEYEKKG